MILKKEDKMTNPWEISEVINLPMVRAPEQL